MELPFRVPGRPKEKALEDPSALRRAGTEGVCGLLAFGNNYPKTIGGTPMPITVLRGVTGRKHPPPGADMLQFIGSP